MSEKSYLKVQIIYFEQRVFFEKNRALEIHKTRKILVIKQGKMLFSHPKLLTPIQTNENTSHNTRRCYTQCNLNHVRFNLRDLTHTKH